MSVKANLVEAVMRRPASRWVACSRWSVALAALIQLPLTAGTMVRLLDDATLVLPRWEALEVTPSLLGVVAAAWSIGAVGLAWSRLTSMLGWMLPLAAGLTIALDRQLWSNHLYLLALVSFLLWAHSVLDRVPATAAVSGVALRAIQAQISIVFIWTAIAKLNPYFLSGGIINGVMGGGVLGIADAWRRPEVLGPLAGVVIAVEVSIALGLWSRRLRRPLLIMAAALHVSIMLFMEPFGDLLVFSLVMGGGYALFAAEPWSPPGPGGREPGGGRSTARSEAVA